MSKKAGRVVYWNGDLVPESEARISIYDSALMFGDMVFEMTRSFNGVQWKLREHLERLYNGIRIYRLPITMTIDEMEEAVEATIKANAPALGEGDEHRVMIDVSRGLLSLYQDVVGVKSGPNVIIADFPLSWTVGGCGQLYDTGIGLTITSQRIIPADLLDPKIKNRSRVHYLMANIEVSLQKGENNWALLLDPDGFIAEGTGSNFFMVKDGVLHTPEPRNILRGITRASVIEDIAPRLDIECIERNIEPYDVYEADEAFVTSTPFCLLPAVSLNGQPIGSGKPGKITNQLLETWGDLVDVDIVSQIKTWEGAGSDEDPDAPSPYRFKPKKNPMMMDVAGEE